MNVLERVKALADHQDLSIPELEKKLGFGNGSIYKWGKSMPSADKLSAVADFFNVSTDYLLGRNGEELSNTTNNPKGKELLQRIKNLCNEKGLTIAELERILGFGNNIISKWDKSVPRSDKLEKLADYFNVTTDYLLGRTENKRGIALSDDTLNNDELNDRDKRDIAKNLEKIVAELDDETAGPLFYGGELPDEDKEILKGILEQALVVAKIKNKAKYTPKKYRNEQQNQQDD